VNLWNRIRQLSLGQLWKLSVLFLKHPFLIFPTLSATKETFVVCNELYGTSHHKSNAANAFRHALWNALVCKRTLKVTKDKQKSVFWAQKVTQLYENVTQNDALDEAMDLHNNALGRIGFLNNLNKSEAEMVSFFQERAEGAKQVNGIEQLNNFKKDLVYISE